MPQSGHDADDGDVAAAVDRLGFGLAQVRVLALAHGVWFVENLQISAAVVSDGARAREASLDTMEQATLISTIFFGIMIGSVVGGLLGDRLGRRPPLLLSYLLAALAQVCTAFVQSYSLLCALRVLIGVAHGVGMPASVAMVSECSPSSLRVTIGSVRQLCFAFGGVAMSALLCYDSPSYRHLHWSWASAMAAIPPVAIGAMASALLPESPVFLASVGRHAEAQAVLHDMQRLNGRSEPPEISMRSNSASLEEVTPQAANSDHLASMCGRRESVWLLTLMLGAMTNNLVGLGHMYAFPHIVNSAHSSWRAGYQNLMQNSTNFVMGLGVVGLTRIFPCRTILVMAGFMGMVGLVMFVETGSMQIRGFQAELLYLVSQNTPMLVSAMGILGVYQLAVDLFPVRARVISAGVCIAAGRVAAISAPFVFETFARWQSFYRLMAALCCITSVLAFTHLPSNGEQEALHPLNTKRKVEGKL